MFHYLIFNKPYGVVSQFTPDGDWKTLRDFGHFPPTVYPVGRLDADSEGLLLLTDDNTVKHRLTDPSFGHPRTYLVQVERLPGVDALKRLRSGIVLDGKPTREAEARLPDPQPVIAERVPPIRFRKTVPTCWLEITLREGRNRQVRRMTAAVGHPAVRLIRTALGSIVMGDLPPGESRPLSANEIESLRRLVLADGPPRPRQRFVRK